MPTATGLSLNRHWVAFTGVHNCLFLPHSVYGTLPLVQCIQCVIIQFQCNCTLVVSKCMPSQDDAGQCRMIQRDVNQTAVTENHCIKRWLNLLSAWYGLVIRTITDTMLQDVTAVCVCVCVLLFRLLVRSVHHYEHYPHHTGQNKTSLASGFCL